MRDSKTVPRLQVSTCGWVPKQARIVITHPLGLLLDFPADHHNAMALVAFGQDCIRALENKNAIEDWSI